MKPDKALSLLSLARKAGQTRSGEFQVEEHIRRKKAVLVLIAEDASENTAHKFEELCSRSGVPSYRYGTKEELGHALGQEYRVVVSMQEPGLAQAVRKLLDEKKGN